MKRLIAASAVLCATCAFAGAALAADDMAGMKMNTDSMDASAPAKGALTDAVVKEVDPSTGLITLQHGALDNIGMPAMTMAFKAKNAAMVKHAHEGDKVKVRVENVNGTPTIVKMEKQ
jgi:Cu/Ag efflux protein CusF